MYIKSQILKPKVKMNTTTFLNPVEVLNQLELRSDMVAAEFGCGSGGFAIPLAKKLENGLVYGIDIQQAPLSALKSRALFEKIRNIKVVRSDLEKPRGSTLGDLSLDLVFIVNVLFQAEEKRNIIQEAKRVLKNGGKLIVVDWLSEGGPGPLEGRVPSDVVKKIADDIGFKLEKEFKAGEYHYGFVFERP